MKCKICNTCTEKRKNGKYVLYCSESCKVIGRQGIPVKCENSDCDSNVTRGVDGRWLKYCCKECRTVCSQSKRRNTWLKTLGADHPSKTATFSEKYKTTSILNSGVEHHMQLKSTKDLRKEKNLAEYGVEHHLRVSEINKKRIKTAIVNGHYIDRSLYNEFDFYYEKVWTLTNEQFRLHYYDINPLNLPRGKYTNHLDHIYSISAGLENKIPPEIISHWTNLRLLDYKSNISKNKRCDKTIEQLYEDINKEKVLL